MPMAAGNPESVDGLIELVVEHGTPPGPVLERATLGPLREVVERLAGAPAAQLRGHEPLRARLEGGRVAADVRADEDAGRAPERVVGGQRLGVGDVEGRARPGRRAAPRRGRRCTTTGPRATLTSSAPRFMRARKAASTSPRVSSVSGTMRTTTSTVGQQVGQLVERRAPARPSSSVRGVRATRTISTSNAVEPALDRLADAAVADDEHAPVGEGVRCGSAPRCRWPGCARSRRAARSRASDEPDRELRGARVVHAGGVVQRHAVGQVRPHGVDAGPEALHHRSRGIRAIARERLGAAAGTAGRRRRRRRGRRRRAPGRRRSRPATSRPSVAPPSTSAWSGHGSSTRSSARSRTLAARRTPGVASLAPWTRAPSAAAASRSGPSGLGCMGMTYAYDSDQRDETESIAVIHRALELGVTLLDTSDVYGPFTNEELVGRALRGHRDAAVVATKCGLVHVPADFTARPRRLARTTSAPRATRRCGRLGVDHDRPLPAAPRRPRDPDRGHVGRVRRARRRRARSARSGSPR